MPHLIDTQDLANDLATVVAKYLFESTAVGGMALALESNGRSDDETTLAMTPYLEAYYPALEAVNTVASALAVRTHNRTFRPMRHTYSANRRSRCNSACTHATGWVCVCSCGGANHGVGHVSHAAAAVA